MAANDFCSMPIDGIIRRDKSMSIDIAKNRILDRVPLDALIGESVELKRQSGRLVGCCPFHEEKTGSFTLYDDHYHCFGCGAHGDAISFVRNKVGLGFIEALKHLSEKYGIDAPELKASKQNFVDSQKRSSYYHIVKEAQAYFRENLENEKAGTEARSYLLQRGFSEQNIDEFGFGLSLDHSNALSRLLLSKGHKEKDIIAASIAFKSKSGRTFDFFQHRLTIPIHDRHGRIIAFGGRSMGDDPAKYKNSRDTELFDKSNTLFGIHRAADYIRKKKRAIVVEGYMDAMMLWSQGFPETVACLGTALTLGHLRILSQLTDAAFLMFDGDRAGRNANLRTVGHALEVPSLAVKVCALPLGDDPDSYIRKEGAEHVEALIKSSDHLLEYAINIKLNQAHGLDIPHIVRSELIPWLHSIENNLQRSYLQSQISQLTGIPLDSIVKGMKETKPLPQQPDKQANIELQEPLESSLRPINRLEGEFLGQLYWAAPGELNLQGLESWITTYMEWDSMWLELAREFIVCLASNESPSSRELGSWQHASLNQVMELLHKLTDRKSLFVASNTSKRHTLLEKIKVAQQTKILNRNKLQLKSKIIDHPQSSEVDEENFRLLGAIHKINQELKTLQKGLNS